MPPSDREQEQAEEAEAHECERRAGGARGLDFPPHQQARQHPEEHADDREIDGEAPNLRGKKRLRVAGAEMRAVEEYRRGVRLLLDQQLLLGAKKRDAVLGKRRVAIDHQLRIAGLALDKERPPEPE